MPTLKSSTSIDELFAEALREKAAEGDYEFLLHHLLAVIHQDGGQYTTLAGYAVSIEDAITRVRDLRSEVANLFKARKKNG